MTLSPEKKEKVLAVARELRKFKADDLIAGCAMFPRSVREELARLVQAKTVVLLGDGEYYAPPTKGAARPPVVAPDEDGIWSMIRYLKEFDEHELVQRVRVSASMVRDVLRPLVKAGYVKQNQAHRRSIRRYELVKDNGVHRPLLYPNGKPRPPAAPDRMWMAMKALKTFQARDLALAAQTSARTAREYCEAIHKAGYLSARMVSRQPTIWRFNRIMDGGPKAPVVRHDSSIYDPNTRTVTWSPEVAHAS